MWLFSCIGLAVVADLLSAMQSEFIRMLAILLVYVVVGGPVQP